MNPFSHISQYIVFLLAPCIQAGERNYVFLHQEMSSIHPYMQKYATQLICCFPLKGKTFLMETDVVSLSGAVGEYIERRARAGILFMHHKNHIQYLSMDDDTQLCFPAIIYTDIKGAHNNGHLY